MTLDLVFLFAAALLGACVGSFLNVVIYRLPHGSVRSLGGRSICPACGAGIRWFDNVPVLSWVLLAGRARCCGARIAFRYPLVELLTAGLFVWLYRACPFPVVADVAVEGSRLLREELVPYPGLVAYLFLAVFVAFLIAGTFIDIDHRILPDALNKPGMVLGVLGGAAVPGLAGFLGIEALPRWLDSALYSLLGLVAGVVLTLVIRALAEKTFRKEAMGLGDVKLMGMIGAFVGWEGALLAFFLGSLFGAIGGTVHRWLTGDPYVFFGPFLALGGWCSLLYRQPILDLFFVQWPQWQREAPEASWILLGAAVAGLFLLVVLVRRARGQSQ